MPLTSLIHFPTSQGDTSIVHLLLKKPKTNYYWKCLQFMISKTIFQKTDSPISEEAHRAVRLPNLWLKTLHLKFCKPYFLKTYSTTPKYFCLKFENISVYVTKLLWFYDQLLIDFSV